jgi:hypothetical protein
VRPSCGGTGDGRYATPARAATSTRGAAPPQLAAEPRGHHVGEAGRRRLGRDQRRRDVERDQHVERGRRRERRPPHPRDLGRERRVGGDVDRHRAGQPRRREVVAGAQRDQRVAGDHARHLDVGQDVEREVERQLAAVGDAGAHPRVRLEPQPDERRHPRRQLDVEIGGADLGAGDDADVERDAIRARVGQERRADAERRACPA